MARHALLIGVQDYAGSGNMTPLACARADVDLMQSILTDAAFTDEPYSVVTLKDAELSETMKTVGDFVAGVDRDDTTIIYFSGHGMRDSDGDLYLCTKDSLEDQLDNTAYPFETLSKSLKRRNLRKVLIILDCCYSGAAGVKDTVTSKFNAVEEVGENGTGTYVISSGGQTETSIEDKDKDYSLFTKVLAEGIRTGDADQNGNGVICVHEIARYVAREVPKRAAQQGRETTGREKRQQPQISSKAAFGEFPIAVNAAKAAEKKRRQDAEIARTWMEDGRKRLAEAVVAKEVEAHRLDDVDRWIAAQGNCETMDLSDPRLTALREYALRSIGLVPFCARWDAAAEISEQPMAAAPEPEPEPVVPNLPAKAMAPPQQDVMATKSPDGAPPFDDTPAEPAAALDAEAVQAAIEAGLHRLKNAHLNGQVAADVVAAIGRSAKGDNGPTCGERQLGALIDYGRKRNTSLKELLAIWNIAGDVATDTPLDVPDTPARTPSATTDGGGVDHSWIIATIVGIAGLALMLFLVHLAILWLVDTVPPVDWYSPYAAWPPGFKILVIAGFLAVTFGLLYAIFSALFEYEADLALGVVAVAVAVLSGVYLLFYPSLPVLAEFDALFIRIMSAYDWVIGLFMTQPPPVPASK